LRHPVASSARKTVQRRRGAVRAGAWPVIGGYQSRVAPVCPGRCGHAHWFFQPQGKEVLVARGAVLLQVPITVAENEVERQVTGIARVQGFNATQQLFIMHDSGGAFCGIARTPGVTQSGENAR